MKLGRKFGSNTVYFCGVACFGGLALFLQGVEELLCREAGSCDEVSQGATCDLVGLQDSAGRH